MRFGLVVVVLTVILALAAGVAVAAPAASNQAYPPLKSQHSPTPKGPPPGVGQYQLLAWSELGMHCIDGKDYSIFAVLPPYNVVHAQLIKMAEPPQRISTGVTITYEATTDPSGSINTISSTKTNFWTYVQTLFLASPPPDVGLTGNSVQNLTPHPLTYDSQLGYWTADGIPTMPYDDQGVRNAYSMAKIVARDTAGNVLATASIVLSVSDEMTCTKCHASNSDQYAMPQSGWENDPDPAKDVKLNVLKKHDDRFDIRPFLSQLQKNGYVYQNTLYQTAKSGTAILCAACHSTNALGAAGLPGIRSLTSNMHVLHGSQLNLDNGQTLDSQTDPQKSCYLCHPGVTDEVPARCDEQDCVLLLPRERLHGGQPETARLARCAGMPDVPYRQPTLHHNLLLARPLAPHQRHHLRHEPGQAYQGHAALPLQLRVTGSSTARAATDRRMPSSRPYRATTTSTASRCRGTPARSPSVPSAILSYRWTSTTGLMESIPSVSHGLTAMATTLTKAGRSSALTATEATTAAPSCRRPPWRARLPPMTADTRRTTPATWSLVTTAITDPAEANPTSGTPAGATARWCPAEPGT